MTSRLVVVSNRVPLPSNKSAAGGPTAALREALDDGRDESNTLWFGWSGRISENAHSVVSLWPSRAMKFVGIDLNEIQYEGYLNGFSNSTLWPLLHEISDQVRFHPDDLALYRAVNGLFAARLLPMLRADDRIWVQDYHLIPLGWMLRQAGIGSPLGFFLHTPFPPASALLAVPWHKKLAEDLAAYDLIGFQSRRDLHNFEDFMRQVRRADSSNWLSGRTTRMPTTGVFPLGVHTRSLMAGASSLDVEGRVDRLTRCLRSRQLVVSADRLDYTKGLIERCKAYERLLDDAPEFRGASSMVQVTAPSRPLVPGYLELRMEQQTAIQRINARFFEMGWMPILDIYSNLPARSVAALYRLGRVGLATPLRDGVNLAAKEYVAAQNPQDPGVLVLSRNAGAAELLTEALLVDPRDIGQVAGAIREGFSMPLDERQDRWRRMIVKLLHHDALQWNHGFLCALSRAHRVNTLRTAFEEATVQSRPASSGPDTAARVASAMRSRSRKINAGRVPSTTPRGAA
jgi:trehalose 6-phosphate synthase